MANEMICEISYKKMIQSFDHKLKKYNIVIKTNHLVYYINIIIKFSYSKLNFRCYNLVKLVNSLHRRSTIISSILHDLF